MTIYQIICRLTSKQMKRFYLQFFTNYNYPNKNVKIPNLLLLQLQIILIFQIGYMIRKLPLVLILSTILFITLVAANQHLNVKYRHVLSSHEELTSEIAKEIYGEFTAKYFPKSEYRFSVFKAKLTKLIEHNKAGHSWTKGINDFSDMTFEEFKEKKLMAPQNCSATYGLKIAQKKVSIPTNYDWLQKGVVTPVKDQGNCGSCWTFSTVGAMQSHWNILGKGRNVLFSQQQLVDCAGAFENYGCDGGLPSQAFEYIRYTGGLETSTTYPYTGMDGECNYRSKVAVGYVRFGSYNITQGDENELAERLYSAGPMSITFEVTDDFVDYYTGIYEQTGCGTTTQDVNHAVLATGYGVEANTPFWNVKNSWGTEWGNNGYFKILRGKNMCAIAQCNAYPLIDRPEGLVDVGDEVKED